MKTMRQLAAGWACALLLLAGGPPGHAQQASGPRLMVQSGDADARELAIAPQGQWLATAGRGKVQLWTAQNGRLLCELPADSARSLLFSADGRQLAAQVQTLGGEAEGSARPGRRDPGLAVWDLARCGLRREHRDDVYRRGTLTPLADGRMLYRRAGRAARHARRWVPFAQGCLRSFGRGVDERISGCRA